MERRRHPPGYRGKRQGACWVVRGRERQAGGKWLFCPPLKAALSVSVVAGALGLAAALGEGWGRGDTSLEALCGGE